MDNTFLSLGYESRKKKKSERWINAFKKKILV